jgi:mRNA interferase MazF
MPFPFSDLSASKLRPAVILADAGRDDWLLCQITSNPLSDLAAVRLTPAQLKHGALSAISYARPLKLFTANTSLIVKRIAILSDTAFSAVLTATIDALRANLPG